MKRFISFFVLFIVMICNVSAQDKDRSGDIRSFITRMYEGKLYENYDFLQTHCSAELLKKLQDAYPYDADGVVYATWLFRSGRQDSKPGSNGKPRMLEVKADNGDWYIYRAIDMGWEFTKRIKIFNKDGKIIISDICPVKD
ncbi:MAG: hypothetical protein J6U73_06700 [Alistipes sp.]|nr:hypothetical protein [Alistipes sp.]